MLVQQTTRELTRHTVSIGKGSKFPIKSSLQKSTVQVIWTFIVLRKQIVIGVILANFFLTYFIYNHFLTFSNDRTGNSGGNETSHRPIFWKDLYVWKSLIGSDNSSADLHFESGETSSHEIDSWKDVKHVVAIGMGMTSRGVANLNENSISAEFQLFTTFLPSFCSTCSSDYGYAFYLAYDFDDQAFSQSSFRNAFHKTFRNFVNINCQAGTKASLHLVQCQHAGKPAWAQNDAMMNAYLDNVEYFYRINDDTVLQTKLWTESFISVLKQYDPPNLGVVGPTHAGGNTLILTYDFVHHTHVDVFGFYYPRLFTDWWGDDWVTNVYIPGRMTKLANVSLAHTLQLGQRYQINNWDVGNKLLKQVATDQETLKRYINSKKMVKYEQADGTKIISMTLFGNEPRYTWGAIRNAQLLQIYFPGWRLRFYIPDPESYKDGGISGSLNKSWIVPEETVRKLKQLGADIEHVGTSERAIPPHCWRYLVADDVKVSYFLIRDADSRFSERDAVVVEEWLSESQMLIQNSSNNISLHCIHDHPKYANQSIIDGLWGGNGLIIRRALLNRTILQELKQYFTYPLQLQAFGKDSKTSNDFLVNVLWPLFSSTHISHDNLQFSDSRKNMRIIKLPRKNCEYLGQKFDEHEQLINSVELDATWCRLLTVFRTSTT